MHEIVHVLFRRLLAWQLPIGHKQAWKVTVLQLYTVRVHALAWEENLVVLDHWMTLFLGPTINFHLREDVWLLPKVKVNAITFVLIFWITHDYPFFALTWIWAQANEKRIFTVCNSCKCKCKLGGGCILRACNRDKIQGFFFCLQEL